MSIHIITHAYSVQLPQYAVFLRAQLSSLILYSGPVDKRITVCHLPEDEAVVKVLDSFQAEMGERLIRLPLCYGDLTRRSIGRNRAALASQGDLVWFADADYFFGPNCLWSLDYVWRHYSPSTRPRLLFPDGVRIHATHQLGDEFWQKHQEANYVIQPDFAEFVWKSYYRAIGGIQIANGDDARQFGYLNDQPHWQVPNPEGTKPFCTVDDTKYRRAISRRGPIERISIPSLYRLRHSRVSYR